MKYTIVWIILDQYYLFYIYRYCFTCLFKHRGSKRIGEEEGGLGLQQDMAQHCAVSKCSNGKYKILGWAKSSVTFISVRKEIKVVPVTLGSNVSLFLP